MTKTALLFSGGLDSFIAHRRYETIEIEHDLIMLDCGTKTNKYEQKNLQFVQPYLKQKPKLVTAPDIAKYEEDSGFVPLRNLVFAALPVMEGYDVVDIAAVKGEGSLDKSPKFFKDTSDLFSYMLDKPIRIHSSVDHLTKTSLVKRAQRSYGVYNYELQTTSSCYNPWDTVTGQCGRCQACVRRWVAMVLNDIYEPYDSNPLERAKELLFRTRLGAIKEQPLGRWPDLILTNKELRDAVHKIEPF